MIGLKEVVITLLILFLLFHKEIFSYYKKHKYRNIDRGDTEKVNIKTGKNIPKVIYKTGIDDYQNIHTDVYNVFSETVKLNPCLLYTSPSPRDGLLSRMPSSA